MSFFFFLSGTQKKMETLTFDSVLNLVNYNAFLNNRIRNLWFCGNFYLQYYPSSVKASITPAVP